MKEEATKWKEGGAQSTRKMAGSKTFHREKVVLDTDCGVEPGWIRSAIPLQVVWFHSTLLPSLHFLILHV